MPICQNSMTKEERTVSKPAIPNHHPQARGNPNLRARKARERRVKSLRKMKIRRKIDVKDVENVSNQKGNKGLPCENYWWDSKSLYEFLINKIINLCETKYSTVIPNSLTLVLSQFSAPG